MSRLVVFAEEESIKPVIQAILGRMDIGSDRYLIITHQGARDLEKSLRNKLRAWRDQRDQFVIIRDNDNGDCYARKQILLDICQSAGCSHRAKVRIVCQELEAWFLGDIQALIRSELPLKHGKHWYRQNRFDDPDAKPNPSEILFNTLRVTGKLRVASAVAPHLDIDNNTSLSFRMTRDAIVQTIKSLNE